MTGSRLLWPTLFFLAFASCAIAQPQSGSVAAPALTPAVVVAGSPELIRVSAPEITSIDGEWLGRKLEFFAGRNRHTWYALAGVDVETPAGPSTLQIHLRAANGAAREIIQAIEIHPAHYRTATLSVAPRFVSPGPEQMKQIEADRAIKKQVFSTSAPEPLWLGSFRTPVHAPPTDSFGTRRIFNGKLDSVHTGMDFRAHAGTIVRAGNSGIVVLARPLYYEGNCVIIDHGLGLYTIYMHFSRFDVHEGQHVVTGQRLGLSGDTGRVTGPHLHWAVSWQGAHLDPAKLLKLNLNTIR